MRSVTGCLNGIRSFHEEVVLDKLSFGRRICPDRVIFHFFREVNCLHFLSLRGRVFSDDHSVDQATAPNVDVI